MMMGQGSMDQQPSQSNRGSSRPQHPNRHVVELSASSQKDLALKDQQTSESSGLARSPFEKELQQI